MECYYTALKPYNIGVTCLCPTNINSNIGEAVYTRPEHLKNTGYNVNEKTIDFLRSIHAEGMDPVELAQRLKKGIENDQLYVLPFTPDPEQTMREYCETLINHVTPQGMKREEERAKKRMEEVARSPYQTTDSGFGKAREDLTWVKDRATN
jgi:short-subunit dehydrogenase